jgi:virginiamycin A acetyltransferase
MKKNKLLIRRVVAWVFRCLEIDVLSPHHQSLFSNSTLSSKAKVYGQYRINNSSIGDYSYISKNSHLSFTTVGKFCSIGPNFMCGWGVHPINGISTSPMFYSTKKQNGFSLSVEDKFVETKPIIIGNDVFIGMNVTILDGIIIGDGAVIGAGSVVVKNVPPYAVVAGNPSRIIKFRFNEQTVEKLLQIKWWNWNPDKLIEVEKNFFDADLWARSYEVIVDHHNL